MQKVITFGCRLNKFESQLIENALLESNSDTTIVINSCTVTNETERQVRQTVRKMKKQYPDHKIVVAGCSAQLRPEEYAAMPEVDLVLGNNEKIDYKNYISSSDKKILVNTPDTNVDKIPVISHFSDQSRAFVQVQNGCNHSCTFCATTIARGKSSSLSVRHILSQIKLFIDNGYNEIVLTGIDLSDFGKDLSEQPSLGDLVKRILITFPNLPRLRLSSIDVAEIDNNLLNLIKHEQRLMPHIHISVQSGDNLILKRMKRRHSREQVIEFSHEISSHRPEIVIGADLIAGFPTETDAMFQNTYDLITEANLTYLHVFPFSPKDNTPASRMPQVPMNIRRERAKQLRHLKQIKINTLHKSLINSTINLLVETHNTARAENFVSVKINDNITNKIKQIISAKIIETPENAMPLAIEV